MTDDERRMAAFNCAIDKTKQLITLSTGVLAIMISFGKDILKGAAPWTAILLLAAWVLFSISIVFGVQLLGRFAGRLQAAPLQPDTLGDPDIADRARYQVRSFIAGVWLTIAFGIAATVTTLVAEGVPRA